jgi:hypothetical protein
LRVPIGSGVVFFTSFACELRWNDRSIEQRRLLFGAKTLRFADIVAGGMNPLTQAIWVAAADGTVIRFSPYANGAESLARMIFKPEPNEPTRDSRWLCDSRSPPPRNALTQGLRAVA